ncbi:uncharacterized protein Dana_GF28155 [Drosophila ananassae]|uniref:Uncharacterized protein n=1 Tax=Drosophila ananassae TaxID=7217 RepID=A0A0N8NZK9_DROAN|nr:uncharacterized protein LOC26515564 [Drosophila ananassae]KPU74612.1 uncharacterized protein Dana_GF28155 [Drosophila ananassae]
MVKKTCRRPSQRDQELLCEFVRKSSTCAACQGSRPCVHIKRVEQWPPASIFSCQFNSCKSPSKLIQDVGGPKVKSSFMQYYVSGERRMRQKKRHGNVFFIIR